MTTLTAPSLERRILQTVKEEVEAKSVNEWPDESVELCLILLRQIRERTAGKLRALQDMLTAGVEAHSFVREGAPALAAAEERVASIRAAIAHLSCSEDTASKRFLGELRSLKGEEKPYRDLLAGALARISAAPSPLDWERLKREADADFAAGRFVRFSTAEEMFKGLTDPD